MNPHKLIPSMFHRRLALLLSIMLVVVVVFAGQMVRLSVVEGADRLALAESRLVKRSFLPTIRGQILDRHGRILAQDRASYDVAVPYGIISGAWTRERARDAAKEARGARWVELSPEQREQLVDDAQPQFDAQVVELWDIICDLGGIERSELERRLSAIAEEVERMKSAVYARQRAAYIEKFGLEQAENVQFSRRPIREEEQAHVVLPSVPDDVAARFRRLAEPFGSMVRVVDGRRREYPWLTRRVVLDRSTLPPPLADDTPIMLEVTGIADHILGSVRTEVWKEDIERRPFIDPRTGELVDLGGYRPGGDMIGVLGVERVFEDHLRGTRGMINARRDTGEEQRVEPEVGTDLHLTLDIALQARVQAILSHDLGLTRVQPWHRNEDLPLNTPLNAAAVAIEVESGDILALVSMPTMAVGEAMDDRQREIHEPFVNRPAEAIYPPGSIIKAMVAAAAVSEGRYALGESVHCAGHFYEDNRTVARCWIYRDKWGLIGHGPLALQEAIARSCNIFFYTLADRLGMARLVEWYQWFGLGRTLDIGLGWRTTDANGNELFIGESAGLVPQDASIEQLKRDGGLNFATIILGIGQGPVAWTPVQAANAFAQLARGGTVRDATLLRADPRGLRSQRAPGRSLNGAAVAAILEGLRQSVMESHGTGYRLHVEGVDARADRIFNASGVKVWGKTGTAQAPPIVVDDDGDGEPETVALAGDHAWFVGLVGPADSGEAQYAIAVIVEYGGSGGRVAGPVANQIVHALQDEQYLPGPDREKSSEGGVIDATARHDTAPEHSG